MHREVAPGETVGRVAKGREHYEGINGALGQSLRCNNGNSIHGDKEYSVNNDADYYYLPNQVVPPTGLSDCPLSRNPFNSCAACRLCSN